MAPRSKGAPLYVIVIADNPDTIEGLAAYLESSGVASAASRALQDVTRFPAAATAVVLFPDDFGADVVVDRVCAWRGARPELLIVVVTSTPQRVRSALEPDGHSLLPIVLPKPAFGWTILDAIREHAFSC